MIWNRFCPIALTSLFKRIVPVCLISSVHLEWYLLYVQFLYNIFKIYTSGKRNVHSFSEYSFDLLSFLELIQDGKTNIKYHLQTDRYEHKDTWLCRCLTPFVVSSYEHRQWIIKYEKKSHNDNIFIIKGV